MRDITPGQEYSYTFQEELGNNQHRWQILIMHVTNVDMKKKTVTYALGNNAENLKQVGVENFDNFKRLIIEGQIKFLREIPQPLVLPNSRLDDID